MSTQIIIKRVTLDVTAPFRVAYLLAKQHFSLRTAYTDRRTRSNSRSRHPEATLSNVVIETGSGKGKHRLTVRPRPI